eukprot:TRINITY_DN11053_c0_g1_i1.p1 TRINITY_DN11053_c0_g1~~TRINITY_DN11053_c0_g1_i1.p1  ORF type:complete len:288 (-),score=-20.39 TRINITY_DN11053_c0_g1_i1:693-1556(-)
MYFYNAFYVMHSWSLKNQILLCFWWNNRLIQFYRLLVMALRNCYTTQHNQWKYNIYEYLQYNILDGQSLFKRIQYVVVSQAHKLNKIPKQGTLQKHQNNNIYTGADLNNCKKIFVYILDCRWSLQYQLQILTLSQYFVVSFLLIENIVSRNIQILFIFIVIYIYTHFQVVRIIITPFSTYTFLKNLFLLILLILLNVVVYNYYPNPYLVRHLETLFLYQIQEFWVSAHENMFYGTYVQQAQNPFVTVPRNMHRSVPRDVQVHEYIVNKGAFLNSSMLQVRATSFKYL